VSTVGQGLEVLFPVGSLSAERIARCEAQVRETLLAERSSAGHWVGELSTSSLSTATAVMALELVRRDRCASPVCSDGELLASSSAARRDDASQQETNQSAADHDGAVDLDRTLRTLISGGLGWLAEHQQEDGGWGDTTKSASNISTSMLAHAAFHATSADETFPSVVSAAAAYIERAGGVEALLSRYGKDKTFSIPILTQSALAGLVDWKDVPPLPFEWAALSPRFYKTVHLPVVSYALPALIAIGQVHYHHRKPANPLTRRLRQKAIRPTLRVLEEIQPTSGGFLEAAPLTSFVTMSLAAMGLSDHPVSRQGVRFLVDSVRPDGSWPIDTNLATWVTTLSVNALREEIPPQDRSALRSWLLGQQYRQRHPYTQADPGGWAWTNLPGGVPDADDTAGALLALLNLRGSASSMDGSARSADAVHVSPPPADDVEGMPSAERIALADGVRWLVNLQNRDRGWPTFCRGWGTLPFDRSAADISAHVLRALIGWTRHPAAQTADGKLRRRAGRAVDSGFEFLAKVQQADGSWLPLWFGNESAPEEQNPTYGTARVLAAYRDSGRMSSRPACDGLRWLLDAQQVDGGWGGAPNVSSSVEETALAVETLLAADPAGTAAHRGLEWLLQRVEAGTYLQTTPIGFYFAKLWYFERLYPQSFVAAALRRARIVLTCLEK
jgi:squalene-hopene/tetraprenyl-beta-curcumene cyclase